MNWVAAIGYVATVVFIFLWRIEVISHKRTKDAYSFIENQFAIAKATIEQLRKEKEAEREALKKLQYIEEQKNKNIDSVSRSTYDELLDFMRNSD